MHKRQVSTYAASLDTYLGSEMATLLGLTALSFRSRIRPICRFCRTP